jgi:hypothetical protein
MLEAAVEHIKEALSEQIKATYYYRLANNIIVVG